ncbi:MAG: Bax inhibitor-1/YccA family protein [Cellulomonadaceae bacterium]|jgi:uncharacterized YccA/Bax inhibitor family protein|nr:Bax inhibitor-1/YccA family protein [Cellulomonadaceae bacterium]
MSNPYFNRSDVFGEPRRDGIGTQRAAGNTAAPTMSPAAVETAALENMYAAPAATAAAMKRMTYDDVIVRTGGLLALLFVVAAATWHLAPGIWPAGMVVGLVLGLVNSFKRNPSPALIMLYTVAQGVFLGGISLAFAGLTVEGAPATALVFQAILATFVTFGVALAVYKSGKIRVTPKFQRAVLIGLGSFLVFQLVNLVLVWTGVVGGWGARGGTIGLVVSVIAIGLATASLLVDFESIKQGVQRGAPQRFAWAAAFGLMVTLVWLYLEFLRLFAIIAGRR